MEDAKEIAEWARSAYDRLDVPPNLRLHMFRVASVVALIRGHWRGPETDFDSTIKAALLHDVGNIVRFDLDSDISKALMGDSIPHWRGVQKSARAKYGREEHAATVAMASELGLDEKVISILKEYDAVGLAAKDGMLEAKVCDYADSRVGVYGVISIADRFRKIKERRKDSIISMLEDIVEAIGAIQNEVLGSTDLKAEEINDASISVYLDALLAGSGMGQSR